MSYGFNSDKSKFPLGLASDLPDPTKPPMQIIGELQNQIIDSASIENGATASKAYASGNYVCFQGALCRASKAISQGDTLSIGTSANDNLTLTDAAAEFVRLNSDLSDLQKHNLTETATLVSAVEYTCPSDGYVNLKLNYDVSPNNKIAFIRVNGIVMLQVNPSEYNGDYFSLFVKKNSIVRFSLQNIYASDAECKFYALT